MKSIRVLLGLSLLVFSNTGYAVRRKLEETNQEHAVEFLKATNQEDRIPRNKKVLPMCYGYGVLRDTELSMEDMERFGSVLSISGNKKILEEQALWIKQQLKVSSMPQYFGGKKESSPFEKALRKERFEEARVISQNSDFLPSNIEHLKIKAAMWIDVFNNCLQENASSELQKKQALFFYDPQNFPSNLQPHISGFIYTALCYGKFDIAELFLNRSRGSSPSNIDKCFQACLCGQLRGDSNLNEERVWFFLFQLPQIEGAPQLTLDNIQNTFREACACNPWALTDPVLARLRVYLGEDHLNRWIQEQDLYTLRSLTREQFLARRCQGQTTSGRHLAFEVHNFADGALYKEVFKKLVDQYANEKIRQWIQNAPQLFQKYSVMLGNSLQEDVLKEISPLFHETYTALLGRIETIDWSQIQQTGCPSVTKENVLKAFYNGLRSKEVFERLPLIVHWAQEREKKRHCTVLDCYLIAALGVYKE